MRNAADWEKIFDFLLKNATDLNFTIDGKAAELPTSASAAIAMRGNASPALQFRWGTIEFATHFFGEDDLEFHFRPELIRSPSDLDKLLSFLAAIGSQIGKIVIVYHEGWEMSPFLEYNKQTCTVTNGSGIVRNSDVQNVEVKCDKKDRNDDDEDDGDD